MVRQRRASRDQPREIARRAGKTHFELDKTLVESSGGLKLDERSSFLLLCRLFRSSASRGAGEERGAGERKGGGSGTVSEKLAGGWLPAGEVPRPSQTPGNAESLDWFGERGKKDKKEEKKVKF